MSSKNPVIVVAGGSGYIGKSLIPILLQKFPEAQIIALSRSQQESEDPRVEWRPCDLFSLKQLELAVPVNTDLAYYLVHSMGPTAQLDQGSFADYDLILADNFARTIKKVNAKQLIYLSGLIPEVDHLSLHLQSRLEVEETFAQSVIPSTVFRAGLILGDQGSSFQILLKLVKRLPVMLCPKWTKTLTSPVDLPTVLRALSESALDEKHINKIYDLAGCQPLTYLSMMKETAKKLGLKRYFMTVPFFTPTLSRLWVSLVTNTPKDLVYPLVESLKHPMVARKHYLFFENSDQGSYFDLLDKASLKTHSGKSLFRFKARRKTVRSVQRLPLPEGKDAHWISEQYIHWLPRFLAPFIKAEVENTKVSMSIFSKRFVLLEMNLSEERSNADRQLLYIEKGLLVSKEFKGRLEFRVALNRRIVLAAIHDFNPSLPWYVYKYSQAIVHLWVMRAFATRLRKIAISQKFV